MSAIVPALNAHGTIRDTVMSALAQTMPDLEVVVVDDGSPEPLWPVLADIGDPRLRVIRFPRNRGTAAARTRAVRAARAPVVAQLDADDLWEPTYLERILPAFADPAVGLVYSNGWLMGHPDGRRTQFTDLGEHPIDSFERLVQANVLLTSGTALRREAVLGVGGYPTALRYSEEWYLYLEVKHAGWRFKYVDEPLVRYRFPDYATHRYSKETLDRSELFVWLLWLKRHPRAMPRGQIRFRVEREIGRQRARLRWGA